MDFRDAPEEAVFRDQLRTWLAGQAGTFPTSGDEYWQRAGEWHRALYEAGFFGLSWPRKYGGRELPPVYDVILDEELARAGAPARPSLGYLAQGLGRHGSELLRQRFLPGMINGSERWCQGFSEPGAGSDLAALSTRAQPHAAAGEPSGDASSYSAGGFLVNGQKVWTSDAAWADLCLLLVRTDPTGPRHRGISALVVDMHAPGVEVRPIVQANGDTEFNEVFFTDVVVPASALVGALGQGWEIAMATVGYERGPADVGFSSRYARVLAELEAAARTAAEAGTPLDATLQAEFAQAHVLVAVLRSHVLRTLSARADGLPPGPEGSIDKLLATRVEQALHHVAMDLAGAGALVGDQPAVLADYLYSRAASIAGGTRQIQLGIVAERVLGLPRSR
nr:acyl-CoA dehydrogenase family protein [Micromonospora sp. DSM 115978]